MNENEIQQDVCKIPVVLDSYVEKLFKTNQTIIYLYLFNLDTRRRFEYCLYSSSRLKILTLWSKGFVTLVKLT